MPLTIPAFTQYQAPTPPLRGLWNQKPPEGDRFISAEIDWGTLGGTPPYACVQFQLSGNSPVALSQIVALSVDNGRCGSDVSFVFPDSSFTLTIPAHNQGVYPVFTNALMFYAVAPNAATGDVTVFQALNSMPPPIPLSPSAFQNHSTAAGLGLATNTNTQLIPIGTSGTVNAISIAGQGVAGASAGSVSFTLIDGQGHVVWGDNLYVPASTTSPFNFSFSGLNVRFVNGLQFQITGTTLTGGSVTANVYYTTP
jgi:hypothetical protein